ncbi:hypothetical protein [Calditerrivibrio nitroreducens]|uniref:Uncharacterized protein n=1 Tax=Calditerrivibrio nitroreducens (strain DSM 19672 / NBRC 101217 / Yu37-1) TaxID=768670 RepID=E4TFK1_CALNY|nr:hypothetical protein [Calditerrivibrio nitroreducens]ADR19574.1 hypothetical protein Calni_1667 [Calditerrivibrio nitroreducens DSM 19672]
MDSFIGLLSKEYLTDVEIQSVLPLLKTDLRDPGVIDQLLKHNILNIITKELLLKKSSEEQVKLLLSGSIPIVPKDIPLVVFLVIKSYPQLFRELFQYLIKLDDTTKKSIVNNILFEGEYLYFLCKLLKNDPMFVSEIIAKSKVDRNLLEILSSSTEPEVLFRVSNLRPILEKDHDLIKALLSNPYTPDESLVYLKQILVDMSLEKPEQEVGEEKSIEEKESERDISDDDLPKEIKKEVEENLYQKISKMTIPQKIKLALKGNKSARMYLIRDPNKQISTSVLSNPKITEDEISFMVRNKSTPEHIIREIGKNNTWINNYSIAKDMVFNPKTPLDISMNLLGRLSLSDIEKLSKSKDVPTALKNQALRIFQAKIGKK